MSHPGITNCWGCGLPAPSGVCTRPHLDIDWAKARKRGDIMGVQGSPRYVLCPCGMVSTAASIAGHVAGHKRRGERFVWRGAA